VPNVPETVIVIDPNSDPIAVFPNPVRVQRDSIVVWHCNPLSIEPIETGFVVVFPNPDWFGRPRADGQIGGSTVLLTVNPDAPIGKHAYTLQIEQRTIDPEIIIEEAPD
jgi:hypothetical protein